MHVAVLDPSSPHRLEGSVIRHGPFPCDEIEALHHLARVGEISADSADRQLNTYLLAVGVPRGDARLARQLVLPIADAPHHTLLPDLGGVLHAILCRQPHPCTLSSVLEQAMPSLRLPARPATYEDSQDVLLNLLLALLLGTYPGGAVKRPLFRTRARVYARVHALLTATPEAQTEFCREHSPALVLAAMEYVARLVPAYMPSQAAFLQERDPTTTASFKRVPLMCNELRQSLDDSDDASDWPRVLAWCSAAVERISRLKKSGLLAAPREPALDPAVLLRHRHSLALHWAAPGMPHGSPHEFHILGHALGLDGQLIRHIQREVRVHPLPVNLRRLQLDAVARMLTGSSLQAFLAGRRFACLHCVLQCKASPTQRMRLDTIRQSLVCSTCSNGDLLSIDMIGRVLRHKSQSYFFCPGCASIQPYSGLHDALCWFGGGQCPHAPPQNPAPARPPCDCCGLPSGASQPCRVDHLTGRMRGFSFCQRHAPPPGVLNQCVNARQLDRFCA